MSRRSVALAIVLALHLAMLAALLLIAPAPPAGRREIGAMELLPDRAPPRAPPKPTPPRPPSKADPNRIRAPDPIVRTPDVPPEDYVLGPIPTVDIRALPNARAELATAAPAAPASNDSAAIGSGPDGKPLYAAEWQREPRDAEVHPYLPRRVPGGSWALIACKTAPQFRVEDCQELGDFPRGSGLARGLRNAAWQFRVLPPRRGGEAIIGAWVQIRFDFRDAAER